jgi:uncharacterized membrane protein YczE
MNVWQKNFTITMGWFSIIFSYILKGMLKVILSDRQGVIAVSQKIKKGIIIWPNLQQLHYLLAIENQ